MLGKRILHLVASLLGACIVLYFIYHTVQGDRGWLAMMRLQSEVDMAKASLEKLQVEHKELDHRVQLLRPGSVDPDLLDEKSRQMLNFSKPGEIMVLTPKTAPVDSAAPPPPDAKIIDVPSK